VRVLFSAGLAPASTRTPSPAHAPSVRSTTGGFRPSAHCFSRRTRCAGNAVKTLMISFKVHGTCDGVSIPRSRCATARETPQQERSEERYRPIDIDRSPGMIGSRRFSGEECHPKHSKHMKANAIGRQPAGLRARQRAAYGEVRDCELRWIASSRLSRIQSSRV
jgi:hypothetical protein